MYRCFLHLASMENLIKLLQAVKPLSEPIEARLRRIIRPMPFNKGDIILSPESVCDNIFYIETGLIRSYYMDKKGQEISNWFMKEGDICIAVLSFLRRVPSFEVHVALEACLCWGITHPELEETYDLHPEFNYHGRIITSDYYCRSEERQVDIKLRSPAERYATLMGKNPELALRVPNKYLASFLGAKERTLNKMKKEYSDKKKKSNNQKGA